MSEFPTWKNIEYKPANVEFSAYKFSENATPIFNEMDRVATNIKKEKVNKDATELLAELSKYNDVDSLLANAGSVYDKAVRNGSSVTVDVFTNLLNNQVNNINVSEGIGAKKEELNLRWRELGADIESKIRDSNIETTKMENEMLRDIFNYLSNQNNAYYNQMNAYFNWLNNTDRNDIERFKAWETARNARNQTRVAKTQIAMDAWNNFLNFYNEQQEKKRIAGEKDRSARLTELEKQTKLLEQQNTNEKTRAEQFNKSMDSFVNPFIKNEDVDEKVISNLQYTKYILSNGKYRVDDKTEIEVDPRSIPYVFSYIKSRPNLTQKDIDIFLQATYLGNSTLVPEEKSDSSSLLEILNKAGSPASNSNRSRISQRNQQQ